MIRPKWLAGPVLYAIGALLAIFLLWSGYRLLTANPKAEAALARNQAEAAQESGTDAVNTVGKAGDREAASAVLTRSNDQEIRDAEGSDAKVADPAKAAGRAALCRRAAYRNDPACRVRQ